MLRMNGRALSSKRPSGLAAFNTARFPPWRPFVVPFASSTHRTIRLQSDDTKFKIVTAAEAEETLAAQRLHRPVAPHLKIYKWQITSVLSSLMRMTGVASSGVFYLFGLAYLSSPYTGLNVTSENMAAAFTALPFAVAAGIKFVVALPFTFHCFNGVRHLVWDTARAMTNVQVVRTGWSVVGAATVSALYLALYV